MAFAAKFSTDGSLIATSYADGTLQINSSLKGELLHKLDLPRAEKSSVEFLPSPKVVEIVFFKNKRLRLSIKT